MEQIDILLIDDDEDEFVIIRDLLADSDLFKANINWKYSYDEALEELIQGKYDVALVDYRLGQKNGIELLKEANSKGVMIPIVVLTGNDDISIDLAAMSEGAFDYLVKDKINSEMLQRSIRYAIQQSNSINLLQASEKRYKTLFERSIDGIFILDESLRIVDVSPSFLEMFQLNYSQIINDELVEIFSNRADYVDFVQKLKSSGGITKETYYFKTKNNPQLIGEISAIVLSSNSKKFSGVQGLIKDMTEQKKLESEMLESERLILTGKLSRSIAHEVRNPLTNLKLALNQLNDEISFSDDHQILVNIIDRNSDRIETLINELMRSSRPQTLERRQVHIVEIIQNVTSQIHDRLLLKEIELTVLKNYDGMVSVDSEKISMALLNLLVNAVESIDHDNGRLTISISRHDSDLILSIEDNGCGIQPTEKNMLFDPFYSKKSSGMGLGLTTVQNVIKAHNGTISVSSEVGTGTTFTINLPDSCD